MEKKFDLKKFLSNNAIIILIILLALFVGCTTQNFFTETNGKNLLLNVAPRFIIACGVSGCLITKGTDLSAGRQVGLAACFSAMLLQSVDYSARMLPWLPDIPWPVALLIVMAIMAASVHQRLHYRIPEGSSFHRYAGHADHRLRPVLRHHQQPAHGRLQAELPDRCQRHAGPHPVPGHLCADRRHLLLVPVQ